MQLGVFLHSFADSFSHSGYSGFDSEGNRLTVPSLLPPIGHVLHPEGASAADQPFRRPALAADAALAIEDVIRSREAARLGIASRPIEDREALKQFYIAAFSSFTETDAGARARAWERLLRSLGYRVPSFHNGWVVGLGKHYYARRFGAAIANQKQWIIEYDQKSDE